MISCWRQRRTRRGKETKMSRTARVKGSGDAFYHVTTRITGRQFLLEDREVKADMLDALRRSAAFSGVLVGSFAVMDDHVHILLKVPRVDPGTVPDDEVVERYTVLAGKEKGDDFRERIDSMSRSGDLAGRDVALNRLRARMYDLSQFMKTFKEVFGRRFRNRRPYVGTIWAERFKSCLVESGSYLASCAKYIALNPVRARMVRHEGEYAWSAVGLARRGDAFATACLAWLRSAFAGDCPWAEWMLRRCGQIVSGRILGSREFVEREIREHAGVLRSRSARARLAREGLYASHGYIADRSAA